MEIHKKLIYSYLNKCLCEEYCSEIEIIFDLKSVGFCHPYVTKYYVDEHTKLFVNACCKFHKLIR